MNIIQTSIDFIFSIGLFINAMLFIPQILKLYRTKDSRELSKITFVGFCLIQIAAILYGYIHQDWVITIGYALSLITCGSATVLIYRYR